MGLDLDALPGGALVRAGLAARARAEVTSAALVVSLAATRLAALGVELADVGEDWPRETELALYLALCRDPSVDDAFARYNALRRELDSFLAAAEHGTTP
ncbi:MAG: hypothetical protein KF729_09375 [Sandaracinaceae bacterium]|nr:hypothetical protein [Sandaracinaceae bacterium]